MSTLKADAVTTKSDNTDLTITGGGTGVPNLEAGFKVGGTAGVPVSGLQVGTDGELITWDASGDPAAVAVGTATHVLTSNGAGAAPTFQAAGGAWAVKASGTLSAAALEITDIGSKTIKIFLTNLEATSASTFGWQVSTDNGVSYISGAVYSYDSVERWNTATANTIGNNENTDSPMIAGPYVGAADLDERAACEITWSGMGGDGYTTANWIGQGANAPTRPTFTVPPPTAWQKTLPGKN